MRRLIQFIYHAFNNFLMAIIKTCWKNSKLTLAVFALITLFLFSNLNKMKIIFSAEDLAGQGFPSADELKSIKSRYQDGVTSLFILSPPEGQFTFTTEELCKIRKWYSFKRNSTPELLSSLSTFDFKNIKRVQREAGNKLIVNNLLDLDCEHVRLNTDPKEVRRILNESPFAMAAEKKERLSILFQFVFKDSKTSKFGSFDPDLVTELRTSVHNDLQTIVPRAKIYWMGAADYQWYVLEGFKFARYVNLAMILFMLLSLRIFFGTWKAGLIFTGTLFLSAIWLFGLKGFVGSSYDVLATGLILLLAISSLEDFTFTCYDQIKSRDWRKSVLKIAVPSFYTSLSTIVGFWSLRNSSVEAVQRMGTWASCGALIQWIMIFIFVPCLLQQFPSLRLWGNEKKALGLSFFSHLAFKSLPTRISLMSLIIYPLALIFYFNLNYNESPNNIFPDKQEYSQSIKYIRESKGWLSSTSLLFEKDIPQEKMQLILDNILASPIAKNIVVKFESPWGIQQWLAKTGNLDELESASYFNISKVSEQLVDENKRTRVLLYLKEDRVESVKGLKDTIADICQKDCHLGGEAIAYADFASMVPRSLVSSLFSSIIEVSLVICFLAFAQRKEKYIPSLLLSAFWGPFFVIMMLGVLNTTLDFWKSIFASILIGLAGDNAVHFLFGSENKNMDAGIEDRGGASIITALLMALGALIYLGSYYKSPREFGVILSIGLLASLFGELWLFHGLIEVEFFHFTKIRKFLSRK